MKTKDMIFMCVCIFITVIVISVLSDRKGKTTITTTTTTMPKTVLKKAVKERIRKRRMKKRASKKHGTQRKISKLKENIKIMTRLIELTNLTGEKKKWRDRRKNMQKRLDYLVDSVTIK